MLTRFLTSSLLLHFAGVFTVTGQVNTTGHTHINDFHASVTQLSGGNGEKWSSYTAKTNQVCNVRFICSHLRDSCHHMTNWLQRILDLFPVTHSFFCKHDMMDYHPFSVGNCSMRRIPSP
jgi:hypothetical protein